MKVGGVLDGLFDFEYEIGAYLRKERKEQDITLKEISEKIGLSVQAISQYELGKRAIKYSIFERIVSLFGMSTPAFLYKYDLYCDYVPPHFEGDVDAYEDFKKSVVEDERDNILDDWEQSIKSKRFVKAEELFDDYGFEIRGYVEDYYEKIEIVEAESGVTVGNMFENEFFNLYDSVVNEIEKFTAYQISKFLTSHCSEIRHWSKRKKRGKKGE